MPKNDSQQNDSQQNDSQQEQEIKRIYSDATFQKMALAKVASDYGGTVRFAIQHDMLWQRTGNSFKLRNAFKSHNKPDAWRGLCGILATEWIKEHIKGGDFVKNVVRFTSTLEHKAKWSEKDKLFFKNINPDPHTTYDQALRKFCEFKNKYHYGAFFGKSYIAFQPGQYQVILTKNHTMASCVYEDGTTWLYDPDIGEVQGAIFVGLVEDYLASTGINSGLTVIAYVPRFNSLKVVHRRTSFSNGPRSQIVHRRTSF